MAGIPVIVPLPIQTKDTTVTVSNRKLLEKDIRLITDRNVLPFHTKFTTKVERIIDKGKEILQISSADVA